MQLMSNIPIEWKETIKKYSQKPRNIIFTNTIKINNTIKTIENVTCKECYWHLMNTDPHTAIAVQQWSIHYPTLMKPVQMCGLKYSNCHLQLFNIEIFNRLFHAISACTT